MDNDGIPRLIFNQVIDLTERFSQAHDLTYTILCYLRGTYLPGVDNITLRGLDFLLIYSQLDSTFPGTLASVMLQLNSV